MHQKVLVDTAYQLVTRDLVPMEQIGVIVPFRSTVWDLRRALNKRGLTEIETGTIHTFSGPRKAGHPLRHGHVRYDRTQSAAAFQCATLR